MTAASRRRLAFFLALLTISATAEVRLFEPASAWEDPGGPAASDADLAFADPGGGYFRNRVFFLLARLDDGSVLTVVIFHWKQWFLGGWGAYAVLASADGGVRLFEERIAEDGLSLAGDRLSLRFQGGLFEGSGSRYTLRLSLSGFSCDLALTGILPPWKPGDGRAVLSDSGDSYMRFGVAVPWGEVAGTLDVDGRSRVVHGQCYADTSVSVLPLDRLHPEQFAFRAFPPSPSDPGGSRFLSLLQYRSHEAFGSREIRQLLFAGNGKWILTSREYECVPMDFIADRDPPIPHPTAFRLRAVGGGSVLEGVFRCSPAYLVTDIFKDMPPWLRDFVSQFLKRPVIFRFLGTFRGTLTGPDGIASPLVLEGAAEYQVLR